MRWTIVIATICAALVWAPEANAPNRGPHVGTYTTSDGKQSFLVPGEYMLAEYEKSCGQLSESVRGNCSQQLAVIAATSRHILAQNDAAWKTAEMDEEVRAFSKKFWNFAAQLPRPNRPPNDR